MPPNTSRLYSDYDSAYDHYEDIITDTPNSNHMENPNDPYLDYFDPQGACDDNEPVCDDNEPTDEAYMPLEVKPQEPVNVLPKSTSQMLPGLLPLMSTDVPPSQSVSHSQRVQPHQLEISQPVSTSDYFQPVSTADYSLPVSQPLCQSRSQSQAVVSQSTQVKQEFNFNLAAAKQRIEAMQSSGFSVGKVYC